MDIAAIYLIRSLDLLPSRNCNDFVPFLGRSWLVKVDVCLAGTTQGHGLVVYM